MRNISFSGLKDHIGLPPSESPIILLYSATYNKSLRRPRFCLSEERTRAERDWHHSIMVRWSERRKTTFSFKSAEFLDNKGVKTRSYPHGLTPLFLPGRRSRELPQ